jgi:beta-N-acetylhexosaminidase
LAGTSVRTLKNCPIPASLSLRQALAQTLLIGVSGASSSQIRDLSTGSRPVGGVVLYGTSNSALTSGVLPEVGRAALPPFLAVDEEGGRVQRIQGLYGNWPSASAQGDLSPAAFRAAITQRAQRLHQLGITLNLAPDVDLGGKGSATGDRAYGSTPQHVISAAGTVAAVLRENDVLPTLTHFPGTSSADGSPTHVIAKVAPITELKGKDTSVFGALTGQGATAVMMSTVTVPGLSSSAGLPSTFDPAVYRLLRSDYRFRGLVISAELSNHPVIASRYGVANASRMALAAGADMVFLFHPGSVDALIDALVGDVQAGRLSESRVQEAARHVLASKGCTSAL